MNWSQLSTIIWLRWRLTRNQFRRAGAVNAVLTVIFLVMSVLIAVAAGVGGIFGGALGLAQASPNVMMLVWDAIVVGFLFFWFIGVVAELQRSESIDLARLLHLPVSLRGIFVMNYIASHVTPSLMIFLPGALGLAIGLIFGKGVLMTLLIPLVLTFIFFVTAWTYCLRGWLVTLMVNPRRRRSVIIMLGMSLALIGQAPNLYFNVYLRHVAHGTANNRPHTQKGIPPSLFLAHDYLPILWLPKGAMTLADDRVLPALLGSLGAFLLGAAGLGRAYRSTLRFYRGSEKTGDSAQPILAPAQAQSAGKSAAARKNFLERRLPFVTEDVAAFALAFFRSFMRAPEIRMALFSNVLIILAIVPVTMMTRTIGHSPGPTAMSFYAAGACAFAFFGLLQLMFNQFGTDRDGFRTIVLSPTRRRDVLLAKNIAVVPIAFTMGVLFLGMITALLHLSPLLFIAGLLKVTANFCFISIAGNWTSIWVPYRMTAGSLKPTKPPAKTVFLILATQLLLPIVALPSFVPPFIGMVFGGLDWLPAPLVDLALSFLLALIAAALYWLSLGDLGRMMENREKAVLLVVSTEVE